MTGLAPALANGLWALSCLPGALAFGRALGDVRRTQERLLLGVLRRNAGSEFGRRHGFARIRSVREYREAVPLATYDDFRVAVDRIAAGEQGVLTSEPVLLLEPTSGSTSAAKLIPYTAGLKADFQRAIAPWVWGLHRRHPGVVTGPAYWSLSPLVRDAAESAGGIPVGFEEDAEYLGAVAAALARAVQAVPPEVRLVRDLESFWYVTLFFLLRCEQLALVSVWSPTFFSLLLERLPRWGERLAADVGRGVLSPPAPLDPGLARRLASRCRPMPARAAHIRRALASGATPAERHALLWPHLRVVSCWADASSRPYAENLVTLLPYAALQPKGLVATEGIVSLPVPGASAPLLALRSHFFEFLPEEGGEPRLAHELETGRVYSVVLTTGGGFYRYRLRDLVEVAGHLRGCPLVRFLGRDGGVSDRFGEKLHERHVRETLDAALARRSLKAAFALVAFEEGGYTLFLEAGGPDEDLAAVGADVEEELCANFHYRCCRDLGQLAPLRVLRVADGGAEAYLRAETEGGQRVGDVKPATLTLGDHWGGVFRGRAVPDLSAVTTCNHERRNP